MSQSGSFSELINNFNNAGYLTNSEVSPQKTSDFLFEEPLTPTSLRVQKWQL